MHAFVTMSTQVGATDCGCQPFAAGALRNQNLVLQAFHLAEKTWNDVY